MRYGLVLFDADNTLFDYDRSEAHALSTTLERSGISHAPEHLPAYRRINKAAWEDLEKGVIDRESLRTVRFSRLFAAIGVDADAEAFSSAYLGELSSTHFLIDGAEETVTALGQSCLLALVTNGFSSVQYPRLAGSSISDAFEGVFVSEEVGVAKPNRGIFDHALEQLAHPDRDDVVMVGDSLTSDMAGARNAGVDGCWYNPRGLAGDGTEIRWQARTLQEVRQIVEGERE